MRPCAPFIAIDLPEEATAALARLQSVLPAGRLVAEENLHLTLAFLGEQEGSALEALHDELETIRVQPFALGFSGLGVFGGDRPRILFADVAPDPVLTDLHRRVTGALHRAGIAVQRARFHPQCDAGPLRDQAHARDRRPPAPVPVRSRRRPPARFFGHGFSASTNPPCTPPARDMTCWRATHWDKHRRPKDGRPTPKDAPVPKPTPRLPDRPDPLQFRLSSRKDPPCAVS